MLNLQQFYLQKKNKKITLTFNIVKIATIVTSNIVASKKIKYLGVIFQENRLFNAHIKSIQVKCLKRLKVLRYLKGLKWGVSKGPLLYIYKVLIRLTIDYGMKVYFNSADSSLKLVEKNTKR